LCKRITQKLGGDITLQTKHEKGSTFTFYVEAERCDPPPKDPKVPLVPLVDKASGSEHAVLRDLRSDSATPIVNSSHESLDRAAEDILDIPKTRESPDDELQEDVFHILLAEDNIINQRLLQRQLIKAGFKVSVANNGLEALDYINTTMVASAGSQLPLHCVLMGEPILLDLPRS
jgi:CheY-like chemotaxis protein